MSGLARDIRAIPSPRKWRRLGAVAAGFSLAILLLISILLFPKWAGSLFSPGWRTTQANEFWAAKPGEWVGFAVDRAPTAYYFNPNSFESFGDRVAYTARFPIKPVLGNAQEISYPAYEDDKYLIDCTKSVSQQIERVVYNKSGEITSHFKNGDAATFDLSRAPQVPPNSILSMGEHIFCDENLRTSLVAEVETTKLTFLSGMPNGQMFYGPSKSSSDPSYQIEAMTVGKFFEDHNVFAELLPGQDVFGPTPMYRTIAQPVQFDCANRKMRSPKINYLDKDNNLQYLGAPDPVPALTFVSGSPLSQLLDVMCGPLVGGKYEGTNYASYNAGGELEQKIIINVDQTGKDLKVRFAASPNGRGEGIGTLSNGRVDRMTLKSTEPQCSGSYDASFSFQNETVSWTFKGKDCGGAMEGHGTAKKTTT
jgi:hypothetical protein